MSEPAQPAAPSAGQSEADVMSDVYAAMGAEAGAKSASSDEAVVEGVSTPTEEATAETPQEKKPEERPKSTEEEIVAAVKAIEDEKKELLTKKAEHFEIARKLQSQKDKQARVSQELTADKQALERERTAFTAEKQQHESLVKQLLEGDVDSKIEALRKLAGNIDVVKLFERLSETAAGVNPKERVLETKLERLERLIEERDQKQVTAREDEARKAREVAEQAEYQRQVREGDALVRQNLATLAANATAFQFPAIAELVEACPDGAKQATAIMYAIGEKMAERGIQMPFSEAPMLIARDVAAFLAKPEGKQFLDGLRKQKTPQTQAPAAPVRTATPGASLPAAASSAMGASLSDLPRTDDQSKQAWRQVNPIDFAREYLPSDLFA